MIHRCVQVPLTRAFGPLRRWQWREKERGVPWMSEAMGRMLGPHVASRSTFGGDMELSSIEPSRPYA